MLYLCVGYYSFRNSFITIKGHFQFWYANCAIPGAKMSPHIPKSRMYRKTKSKITVAPPLSREGMKNGILLSAMMNPAETAWLCSNALMSSMTHSIPIGTKCVWLFMNAKAHSPRKIHARPPIINTAHRLPVHNR